MKELLFFVFQVNCSLLALDSSLPIVWTPLIVIVSLSLPLSPFSSTTHSHSDIGVPNLANKNTGHPIKFQLNNEKHLI